MPLKTQLCDSRGQVIEQILFARLDMPENIPDSDLAPAVHTEGMRWVRQGPSHDTASPALSAFRASELPPGFHLTMAGTQTLGGATRSRQPSGVLGWTRHGVGIRRSSAPERAGRRRRAGVRAPSRRCRDWLAWAPDSPSPPSCRATRSPRSARCRPRRWSSSRTRSNPSAPRSAAPVADRRCTSALRFLLYSRPGCGLCEEMLAELRRCRRRSSSRSKCSMSTPMPRHGLASGTRFRCCCSAENWFAAGVLDVEEVHKALAHHG